MMGSSYLKILWFGVKTCSTSAKSNGTAYLSELSTTSRKLHAWVKNHGLRPLLPLLSTPQTTRMKRGGKCTKPLTGQPLLKTSQKKKSATNSANSSVQTCSICSSKYPGEPSLAERLKDTSWATCSIPGDTKSRDVPMEYRLKSRDWAN